MSLIAFFGALELGLVFGLVAMGMYISFRVLNFPDLTVDGSLPLGAAVAATLIVAGVNPYLATGVAFLAGAAAGSVTAWLNVKLKILHLLASILTMIALYSVNLRIMGRPNIALLGEPTIFDDFQALAPSYWINPLIMLFVIVLAKWLVDRFLASEIGLAMRATGANPRMARAQGIKTGRLIILGIALANGLVAMAGAFFAQLFGSADITMGVGVIVIGLAAVIIGEAVFAQKTLFVATLAAIVGSIIYRLLIAFALDISFLGLQAQDLKFITAVLIVLAMTFPRFRPRLWGRRTQTKAVKP